MFRELGDRRPVARNVLRGRRMRGSSVWLLTLAACGAPDVGAVDGAATETWSPPPARDGNLRVATFNIRNFPFLPPADGAEAPGTPLAYQLDTDDEALLDLLEKLQFDVLAVQEIVDAPLFDALLAKLSERTGRDYDFAASSNAHSGNSQHVGFAVASDAAELVWTREHPEVDPRGTLRSGFSARIESRVDGGATFGMMSLHLASGDSAKRAELRAAQAAQVASIVAAQILETGDSDYVVVGDLNTAREEKELGGLDAAFGEALARQPLDRACSAYWIKKSNQPLLRPSLLDHVYIAGMDERDPEIPVAVGAHCAVQRCETYESTSPESGGSFWGVSDHCPVYFEVVDRSRDVFSGE